MCEPVGSTGDTALCGSIVSSLSGVVFNSAADAGVRQKLLSGGHPLRHPSSLVTAAGHWAGVRQQLLPERAARWACLTATPLTLLLPHLMPDNGVIT